MKIDFETAEGQPQETNIDELYKSLEGSGLQPTGYSKDGMTIQFKDSKGLPYNVDTQEVMQKLGHKNVNMTPQNVSYEHVDPAIRAVVSKLPDDMAKKSYIEAKMREKGLQGAQVVGSGRDWYTYSPHTNQWLGVTNSPDWDSSDLAEAAIETPRVLGSIAGGVLGGGSGFLGAGPAGSVAGAALGAGAGGAAVDTATRGALSYIDPEYAKATTIGAQAKDVATAAGVDSVLTGMTGGLSKVIPGFGKAAMTGPISSAAKAVSRPVAGAGELVSTGANAVANSPLATGLVTSMTPGLGTAQMAGFAAQAPKTIVQGGLNLASQAKNSGLAKNVLGEEGAHAIGTGADQLMKKRLPQTWGEKMGSFFRQGPNGTAEPAEATLRDTMGNIGESLASKASPKGDQILADAFEQAAKSKTPMSEEQFANYLIERAAKADAADQAARAAGGRYGEAAGQSMESAAAVGRALEKGSEGIVRGGLYGLGAAGKGTAKAARGVGQLADAVKPIENLGYLTYGAEEGRKKLRDRYNKRVNDANLYPNNQIGAK